MFISVLYSCNRNNIMASSKAVAWQNIMASPTVIFIDLMIFFFSTLLELIYFENNSWEVGGHL